MFYFVKENPKQWFNIHLKWSLKVRNEWSLEVCAMYINIHCNGIHTCFTCWDTISNFWELNYLGMHKQDLPTKMCFEHFYVRCYTTLVLCYTVFLIAWLLWRMLNLNYAVYTTLNSYNREQTQCKQKISIMSSKLLSINTGKLYLIWNCE